MEIENEKKGWSWLGFFFAPFYYAGYRRFGKGLFLLFLGLIPIFGLVAYIYGGLKAKKELPIGKEKFSWVNVIGLIGLGIGIIGALSSFLINSLTVEQTPNCQDEIVTEKLYGKLKEQTAKNMQQMGVSLDEATWNAMGLKIFDFEIVSYDGTTDSYQCKANMSVKENRSIVSPFQYSVSSEDGELIVNIKDLEVNHYEEDDSIKNNSTNFSDNSYTEEVNEEVQEETTLDLYEIAGTHCNENENVIFSCDVGKKIVSVCSSKNLSNPAMQYRFGRIGNIEASVPSNPNNFHNSVTGYHLNVGGTAEVKGMEFINGDVTYGINTIENYLYVRKNGKDIANLTCRDKAKDNIKIGYLRKLGIEIEED